MAISGIITIDIGLPNESANSDSLYTAFTKINDNFTTLFACSSPYNIFTGNGITVNANSNTGTLSFTNLGVTSLTAGTGITLSAGNGDVTISASGNGNVGVTSVGLIPASNSRLTVSGSPIISSGNMSIDLAQTGVSAGTYIYPTLTVDGYGRITNISNATSVGTVTSVSVVPGTGISVTGSPITSNGNITITNTGVTRINAGSGIVVSSSNGNVTVTATGAGSPGIQGVQGLQGPQGPAASNILEQYTTSDLADATNPINTLYKNYGQMVFNTDNYLIYVSGGSFPSDNWYASDGSTPITPT
jgi:hypothetical protein